MWRCWIWPDDITCWFGSRATVIYYTSHSFFYIFFFILPVQATHLAFHSCAITHLFSLAFACCLPKYIFLCVTLVYLTRHLSWAEWLIKQWHCSFASLSYSNPSSAPYFDLLPFSPCLVSLSHIISVSSIHQYVLKQGCSFPWGWVATWPTGYLTSSPPPLPAPKFSTHSPSIHPPPQHPQMTQNPPALQPSSISHSESRHTMDLCVCSFGYTRTVTAVKD